MEVAQKPRGAARFRAYELVSGAMLHWIMPRLAAYVAVVVDSRAFVSGRGVGVCLDVAEAGGAIRANGSLAAVVFLHHPKGYTDVTLGGTTSNAVLRTDMSAN